MRFLKSGVSWLSCRGYFDVLRNFGIKIWLLVIRFAYVICFCGLRADKVVVVIFSYRWGN